MAIMPYEAELVPVGTPEAPDRNDQYLHTTFTEASDPYAADQAWKTHAVGYRIAGFVHEGAITPEGYLVPELDGSRGPNTDYYLAQRPDNPNDVSTIRKDNLAPGGTYHDLPAYKLCGHALSAEGRAYLDSLTDQDTRVKEIGALARSAEGGPLGAHELFRTIIHEAQGKGEVWFFTIVAPTYDSLAKSYGARNFEVIGDDIQIPDDRVNKDLWLRPTIVHPDQYIDNILASYLDSEALRTDALALGDEKMARSANQDAIRFKKNLLFFTDGLEEDQMSELVGAYRKLFQAEVAVKEITKRQQRTATQVGPVAVAQSA